MSETFEVRVSDDRVVEVHDTGSTSGSAMTLLWHHGSPQTGALLAPLVDAATPRGIRVLSYARPSYGTSTPYPGRSIAAAGVDIAAIVDAAGVDRFATMGASGGGPHALASAWALPGRVSGVVCIAGIAPYGPVAGGLDGDAYFAGMAAEGGLRAALEGRDARARFAEVDEFDPASFVRSDYVALGAEWAPLGADAQAANAAGFDGLVDDEVAFVEPWGFDVAAVRTPVLLVQGSRDRVVPASHAAAQLDALRDAELWTRPRDGHVAVLRAVPLALDWLLARR